jgi:hypothetical protein
VIRVALWLLCAGVSYAASFQTPGPALFPIAPDKAQPRQRALNVAFWGTTGGLKVFGPEPQEVNRPGVKTPRETYDIFADFTSVLNGFPNIKRAAAEGDRAGFLRMSPSLWYGVRTGSDQRLVWDGRVSCSGTFFWVSPRHPKIPIGWKGLTEVRQRVRLKVHVQGQGCLGGGVGVTLQEPVSWRLSDIGLTPQVEYFVNWASAWESPFSEWRDPKPPLAEAATYSMEPIVLADVVETMIENPATHERRVVKTPTGWVVSAGIFKRGF